MKMVDLFSYLNLKLGGGHDKGNTWYYNRMKNRRIHFSLSLHHFIFKLSLFQISYGKTFSMYEKVSLINRVLFSVISDF